MVPPFYDSSTPSSMVSICCSKEENIYEVTHVEPEFDTIWDEELSITSSKDIQDMVYEDPVERDMIIPDP